MFDVIYRWIRLNELYKLLESFFQISESFFELTTVFQIIVALGFCMRGGGGTFAVTDCCTAVSRSFSDN